MLRRCSSLIAGAAALAIPAFSLAPAAQAQLANVGSIEVSDTAVDPGDPNLQNNFALAELRAFDLTNTNIAPTGTPTSPQGAGFGSSLTDAIDNSEDQAFGGGSVWHTIENNTAVPSTYTLTFASPVTLQSIQLFGRTDCCQNRDNELLLTLRDPSGTVLFTTPTGITDDASQRVTIAVPEPASLGLLALGGLGLLARRRR